MVFDLILSERHHFFDQSIAIKSICQKRKASILINECGGLVIPKATSFRLDKCGEESELGTLEYLFREDRHYLFVHEDWEFQLFSAIKLPELIWK
jgi:hypothetical protein